jgi:hypothetical protein
MLDIIDVPNTIESVAADFPAATLESQNQLGEQIAGLWSAHVDAKKAARTTNSELRSLRAKLGEQLSRMKEVLAKPGRGGQWSAFLLERGIPRASADRLVARHLRSVNPDVNFLSEPISEPTDEEVQKLFTTVWPKLRRTLRSPQSFYRFIDLLSFTFDDACRCVTDKGIFVLKPVEPTCPVSSGGQTVTEPELDSAQPLIPDQEPM